VALPDNGSAEVVALLVVGGLVVVMRWVFKPSRPHRATRINAADARELGLLTVIATVDRAGAAAQRLRLSNAGIRVSTSLRNDGHFDLLVFNRDAERARELLA
jgi:hypothetical protein